MTGSSRILSDFAVGPEYINFVVLKSGSVRGLGLKGHIFTASPIEITTPDTTSHIIVKISVAAVVCTISYFDKWNYYKRG